MFFKNRAFPLIELLERFSKVSSDSAHEVPAEIGRSAFSNRKELLGDPIIVVAIIGILAVIFSFFPATVPTTETA